MLTPSLGATIPVLKSWFAWGNLDSLRRSEASSASPLGISISAEVLDRKANSGRAPARSVCGVEPEAALERTGGDAGFAEATQALDKEWRGRECIGAIN